jgi:hypothetical protein
MSRLPVVFGVLGVSVMLLAAGARPEAAAVAPPKEDPLALKLMSPIKTPTIDNKTPLKDLLDFLHTNYKLDIDINEAAFKGDGIDNVLDMQLGDRVLPKTENIRLERLLRRVLARIPSPSGATFVLRRDGIEITTNQAIRTQIWGGHQGPYFPLVHAVIEKKPLDEALRDLADQAEHNIVVDARAAEKAKTAVSARFTNTPLDTAVALLADMAELKPVLQDNVIYITTLDNAMRWEGRQKKETAAESDAPAGPRVGSGVRGFVPPMAAGME